MWFSILVLSFAAFANVESHTLHIGRTCPDFVAFPNLSLDKILGTWFVVYQLDTSNTCQVWNLTRSTTNSEQLVLTESRQLYFADFVGINHKQSISANIDIKNPEVPSRMRIRWPTSWTGKADFTIFDTDYTNYVAISQCDRAGFLHRRDVTILSKTTDLDELFVRRVRRLMENADTSHSSLNKISHQQCQVSGYKDWKIDSELFGLLPSNTDKAAITSFGKDIDEYDISQIEIIGEFIEGPSGSFSKIKPSLK